jgi:hypothetical protein
MKITNRPIFRAEAEIGRVKGGLHDITKVVLGELYVLGGMGPEIIADGLRA